MKPRYYQTIFLCIIILVLYGCSRSYSFFAFSYPPESQPHENNWDYSGRIISWDPFLKKPTDKGKRKIQIIVRNKENNIVLEDDLEFNCAPISQKVMWMSLEKLSIELYEQGNQFAEDEHNKQLAEGGPRHLISLLYLWDGEKYIRRNADRDRDAHR